MIGGTLWAAKLGYGRHTNHKIEAHDHCCIRNANPLNSRGRTEAPWEQGRHDEMIRRLIQLTEKTKKEV
jgi:hypothetical protein